MVGENKRHYFIIVIQAKYIYNNNVLGSQLYSVTDGHSR